MPQSSYCIDSKLIDQPIHSGVHPSLHPNCYHQIMYCKLNSNIKYPSPYEHLVWDYNKTNAEGIKKCIESITWELIFCNKSVHKQVSIFNEILTGVILGQHPEDTKRALFTAKKLKRAPVI